MVGLILLFRAISISIELGRDEKIPGGPDLLNVPPALRTKLRVRLAGLKALPVQHADKKSFSVALDALDAVAFPEKYTAVRGSKLINQIIREEGWVEWWTCEARIEYLITKKGPAAQCGNVPRDQLRTCARVSPSVSFLAGCIGLTSFIPLLFRRSVSRSATVQKVSCHVRQPLDLVHLRLRSTQTLI